MHARARRSLTTGPTRNVMSSCSHLSKVCFPRPSLDGLPILLQKWRIRNLKIKLEMKHIVFRLQLCFLESEITAQFNAFGCSACRVELFNRHSFLGEAF